MQNLVAESSAGFIIFRNDGKRRLYLILHYGVGHWDYAKGHIEPGESEQQAALREAKEEAGLTSLEIMPGFREKITYHFKRAGKFITKTVMFFLARTDEENIVLSDEHSGYKWLEYDEALGEITYDSSKQVLKKADKFLDEFRTQTTLGSF